MILNRRKTTDYIWITVAVYCSFYIHRLDIVQSLGAFKSGLLAYLIFIILHLLTRGTVCCNLKQRRSS